MNQNNNYNFDPMTGQPINQQPQRPMQNQSNINMYSQPQQPVQPTMNTYQQPVQLQQPKKKVNTKMIIIISVIIAVVIVGIIFVPKLFGSKGGIIGNDNITDISAYELSEILDEINIFEDQYSFIANDNVKVHMIEENWNVILNGKSDLKEYYVDVRIYNSFDEVVNNSIYDDTKMANINYEINTGNEVLFSYLNSDGNIDVVTYAYKLDNQILGFIVPWWLNNGEGLEINIEDAKKIIYNCKETISTDKGYDSAQDKIMQYGIFGNYMIKDAEMIKKIYNDAFYIARDYTDEKTNEFVSTNIEIRFNDTEDGLFNFEGDITEEKKFDGFNLLWDGVGGQALVIMSKQDYKYYLKIRKSIEFDAKIPSIEESYKIFNSFFEKKVSNEK